MCKARSRGAGDGVGRHDDEQQVPDGDDVGRTLEGVSGVRAKKGFRRDTRPSKSAGPFV